MADLLPKLKVPQENSGVHYNEVLSRTGRCTRDVTSSGQRFAKAEFQPLQAIFLHGCWGFPTIAVTHGN
ncbi:uncharacterized protein PHALS_06333 [Plasmopara halstedii]|uniref:Uncharacterized protein n=1 Tax=Plasmopara halstedii TaxID=4781 RepID=A0A0P1B1G1_PLAHL|nr:uncharacterized protein PHALS_06333 [Plasmopara halstedii]CEG48514.1 hypothetical protein PHALS_06333 [Plasmopara halstedii]|eukprot:XP_024584883.1 hypothetical protein PHALS_06333 [Plasmopara halstedii]